ncbi:heavy-metal-associated domain-containing protein [Thiotrichales bacterium HSG1]|nr:heavy-metal-associated domain-containing protein [Thiotrichales bacterium HSG1]
MTTKTVTIPKISCEHCTNTIEQEIAELEGINSVITNKNEKTATIDWNETTIKWEQIAALLEEIGFPAN